MNAEHLFLKSDIHGPWAPEFEKIYFGMGCFWGAEKKLWAVPGVKVTAVGYMGGTASDPTYPQVCTGETGHAEIVLVVYDPAEVDFYELMKVFWENHDPTQGNRQGNDIGTQYRSAIYWTTDAQRDFVLKTKAAYREVLSLAGLPEITTEISAAEGKIFWYAEEYHQQYLIKNPNGYDCHANTGSALPSQDLIEL